MKRVFLIADDFGLSEAVNHAILRAHRDGALTGASLMLGQPGTPHAIALARETPTLQVGWHLHLCDARPVTRGEWPWGNSPWRAGLALGATAAHRELAAKELAAQWQLFQSAGLRCDFVNGHHHLHVHPVALRELRRLLPADFAGWVRAFDLRLFGGRVSLDAWLAKLASPSRRRALLRLGFRVSDTLWGVDRTFAMQASEVRCAVERLPAGRHEFLFHPRRSDNDADLAALIELRGALPPALPSPPGSA